MEIIGYIIALLIGFSLGLIGGGGSILTVPVLVYLMNVAPETATGYSLFIVGLTSLVGGTRAYLQKEVDFKSITLFGIPSILTIFIARHFVLPAIPQKIFSIGSLSIEKGSFLMLIFALLMLSSSFFMLRDPKGRESLEQVSTNDLGRYGFLALLLPGLLVGFTTGLLGAGGGFLIVPVLVLIIGLPMKTAIGTSLLIIAINSIFGFVFSIGRYHFDWSLLLIFTVLAIIGVFIGNQLAQKFKSSSLRRIFGIFVLLMGLAIIIKEIYF